jgi:hypothetical protein
MVSASFLDAEFYLKRHQAADAMTEVYGLSYRRSRELFDLTLVAVRRELVSNRHLPPIPPKALIGNRGRALIRFAKHLSPDEFTRLAVLLRDIAPSAVYAVRPANIAAMRRGEPGPIRTNLGLVLYGSPYDRPLFASKPAKEGR